MNSQLPVGDGGQVLLFQFADTIDNYKGTPYLGKFSMKIGKLIGT